LANGEVYRLIPERKRKGHYIDQDGNRADVEKSGGYKLDLSLEEPATGRDARRGYWQVNVLGQHKSAT
jgi:hypothetical protein